MRLTFKGWERFDELQHEQADSRHAFMAMAFNQPELEEVFEPGLPAAMRARFADLIVR